MSITPHESTTLALADEQTYWTDEQTKALSHIGVDKAAPGDLQVFFHVCKRSGLDPFARQIYMIGRQTSEKGPDGQWHKVTKQTIQTGIDGFRLIGRRAADRGRHAVSVKAPEWAHEDGSWRPIWSASWGHPVAARVTIERAGQPFTAVALFDEYKQTKYGGELTAMWAQRPAGMLAKCAEGLAWRMAFPQDLSGIYTDEEMAQADSTAQSPQRATRPSNSLDAVLADPDPVDVTDAEVIEDEPGPVPLDVKSDLAKAMFASIKEAGITEAERLPWIAGVIGREVTTSKEMTTDDARLVLRSLDGERTDEPGVDA